MKRKAEAIQEEGAASSVVEAKEQEEQEQEEGGQAVKQEPEDNYDAGTQERGARVKCPYLDTVDRHVIDFDSEKLCSVTLTNMNVYVCLVCGKYFQGRGKQTPAFTHSVQAGHFVFMNLGSGRAYCLPDGYEVQDASLLDVQSCLSPRYALHEIAALNSGTSLARDVYGTSYLPGFVGLNNLARTDYLNALLHALAHVSPFRDFWLQPQLYSMAKSNIVQLFGLTLRKIWSSSNFKSIVSPQELMQEVVVQSGRRFGIQQRAECLDLFVWLMDQLHRGLGRAAAEGAPAKARRGGGMSEASVLYEPFLGVIEVTSLTKQLVSGAEELGEAAWGEGEGGGWVRSVTRMPFTYLSLDIPPCPLFRDSEGGLVIPQVPLFQLLQKFDGHTWTDQVTAEALVRRKYRIVQLPQFLVLQLVRFTRNNFYLEKNPSTVTFPVKNLEMKPFLKTEAEEAEAGGAAGAEAGAMPGGRKSAKGAGEAARRQKMLAACPPLERLPKLSTAALRSLVSKMGSQLHKLQAGTIPSGEGERERLLGVARGVVERVRGFGATKYDLCANVCHESASSAFSKGAVAVGDLNMLMGQPTAKKPAVVVEEGRVHTSSAAAGSNNRVLNEGAYKVHVQHRATGQWFEMQDLRVGEVTPQLIGVSESNILIYERKTAL